MLELLTKIGIEVKFLIVGLIGGFLAVVAKRKQNNAKGLPHQTLSGQITTIITGGLVANYLSPLIINFIDISEKGQFGIAFIVGYLGLVAMETIIDKINIDYEKSKQ